MELKCGKTGNDGHGAMRQCIMPDGHEQCADPRDHKHLFRGKVTNITLSYEQDGALEPSIGDDIIENIADDLNDTDSRYRYSNEQIKAAVWKFMQEHIDDFVENLEEHWWKYFQDLSDAKKDRLLGEPERDLKQEQLEEYGDYRYDASHGN